MNNARLWDVSIDLCPLAYQFKAGNPTEFRDFLRDFSSFPKSISIFDVFTDAVVITLLVSSNIFLQFFVKFFPDIFVFPGLALSSLPGNSHHLFWHLVFLLYSLILCSHFSYSTLTTSLILFYSSSGSLSMRFRSSIPDILLENDNYILKIMYWKLS